MERKIPTGCEQTTISWELRVFMTEPDGEITAERREEHSHAERGNEGGERGNEGAPRSTGNCWDKMRHDLNE